MRRRQGRLAVLILVCAVGAACRPALRGQDQLTDPTAEARGTARAADVDRLLDSAAALFARREIGDAREAVRLWLEAAAADPGRVDGLVAAARAQSWLAGHEEDAEARKAAARAAVATGQWCERVAPDSPECAYALGVALGVQARELRSTAKSALPEILARLQRVADDDPTIDSAGPDRVLCEIYLRAPGWPVGPGDPDLAVEHGERAVELAPDYPPNHLCLADALDTTGDGERATAGYRRAAELARERLATGERAAVPWLDEAEKALEGRHPGPGDAG